MFTQVKLFLLLALLMLTDCRVASVSHSDHLNAPQFKRNETRKKT